MHARFRMSRKILGSKKNKFWNSVKSEGGYEKHVVANAKAGFEELKKGQIVMFIQTDVLRGAYYEDPKSMQGIKLFGVSRSEYFKLIFTKNSPLVPLFNQATTRLFENGQFLRTDFKWKGNKIKDEGVVDILILTSGQVFLIYAILAFFLGLSIIFLTFECCYKKINGSVVKHPTLPVNQIKVCAPKSARKNRHRQKISNHHAEIARRNCHA